MSDEITPLQLIVVDEVEGWCDPATGVCAPVLPEDAEDRLTDTSREADSR